METVSIALICSIVGAIIGVATFSKNRTKDLKADTKEEAETRTKLDYIILVEVLMISELISKLNKEKCKR